jgi:hypothetical protein
LARYSFLRGTAAGAALLLVMACGSGNTGPAHLSAGLPVSAASPSPSASGPPASDGDRSHTAQASDELGLERSTVRSTDGAQACLVPQLTEALGNEIGTLVASFRGVSRSGARVSYELSRDDQSGYSSLSFDAGRNPGVWLGVIVSAFSVEDQFGEEFRTWESFSNWQSSIGQPPTKIEVSGFSYALTQGETPWMSARFVTVAFDRVLVIDVYPSHTPSGGRNFAAPLDDTVMFASTVHNILCP